MEEQEAKKIDQKDDTEHSKSDLTSDSIKKIGYCPRIPQNSPLILIKLVGGVILLIFVTPIIVYSFSKSQTWGIEQFYFGFISLAQFLVNTCFLFISLALASSLFIFGEYFVMSDKQKYMMSNAKRDWCLLLSIIPILTVFLSSVIQFVVFYCIVHEIVPRIILLISNYSSLIIYFTLYVYWSKFFNKCKYFHS